MPTLQSVRCPGAGVFQKEGQEDAVEDVEEMVLEVHHGRCAVVKMAGNVLLEGGFQCQRRALLKGLEPCVTHTKAGTP